MLSFAQFVLEAAKRKQTGAQTLANDFFSVFAKPDEPLEPFGKKKDEDEEDDEEGDLKPSGEVPDDVNPFAPVPTGGRRNDTTPDAPFISGAV